ncbi:MarR family winged helix-turn-helix transcriptional regulator [Coralloluteibacterium stylophorae]|uniref:MarR family transcriptional regulator n=1 Tax=Coralloluteibacterium stylophorae TaxID=1776034 RepID=A0A8J7VVD6_9GAMM|nr:MarR family transcriptional regulator [Coralloluteibacterium stylophorae]MBS7459035.1 MarR family transcriptional regulator [Coralloluteibacterium stylophorae]
MSRFAATEERLRVTRRKHRGFPRDAAALIRLVKLLHKLIHDNANAVLRDYGLTHPEYNVLMMLDGSEDGMAVSALAEAAGEKSANMTRLTTQLVDKGLITRAASESDRRMLVLRLTGDGEALIERVLPAITRQLRGYVGDLDGAAQAELEALLKRLLAGVEAASTPERG